MTSYDWYIHRLSRQELNQHLGLEPSADINRLTRFSRRYRLRSQLRNRLTGPSAEHTQN